MPAPRPVTRKSAAVAGMNRTGFPGGRLDESRRHGGFVSLGMYREGHPLNEAAPWGSLSPARPHQPDQSREPGRVRPVPPGRTIRGSEFQTGRTP